MPRVALLTSRALPDLPPEDAPLLAALAASGVEARPVVWDDPAFAPAEWDLALVRATWDYPQRSDEFLAFLERAARATRVENPPALARWNADKSYLRELEAGGVDLVPTAWIPRGGSVDLAALLAERGWREAVVKPVVDVGALQALRVGVDAPEAGQRHLDARLPSVGMMVQPFLPEIREGEVSLVFFEGAFSHALRKVPVAGEWRVQRAYGGRALPHAPTSDERAAASRVLAALPAPPLYARVDLVTTSDDVVRLMELELIEPILFWETAPGAAARFADAIARAALAPHP